MGDLDTAIYDDIGSFLSSHLLEDENTVTPGDIKEMIMELLELGTTMVLEILNATISLPVFWDIQLQFTTPKHLSILSEKKPIRHDYMNESDSFRSSEYSHKKSKSVFTSSVKKSWRWIPIFHQLPC